MNTGPRTESPAAGPPWSSRRVYTLGAVSALAAGGLSVAGGLWGYSHPDEPGFTVESAFTLAAAVLYAPVLWAFVRLNRDSGDTDKHPLHRSAVCTAVSVWVLVTGGTLTELLLPDRPTAMFVCLVGLAVTLAATFAYALGGGGIGTIAVAYVTVKYPIGWLLTGERLDSGTAFAIGTGLLAVVALVAFPVWLATTLYRGRDRYGGWAAMLAGVLVFAVAAGVAAGVWVVVRLTQLPRPVDPDALDQFFTAHLGWLTWSAAAADAVVGLATAAFLWASQSHAPPPAPAEPADRPA